MISPKSLALPTLPPTADILASVIPYPFNAFLSRSPSTISLSRSQSQTRSGLSLALSRSQSRSRFNPIAISRSKSRAGTAAALPIKRSPTGVTIDPRSEISKYDTLVLIDDAPSATFHWEETMEMLKKLVEVNKKYDGEGVQIVFVRSRVRGVGVTTAEEVERLLTQVKPSIGTSSDSLAGSLASILGDYANLFTPATTTPALPPRRGSKPLRPLSLLTLTYGCPADGYLPLVLHNVGKRLDVCQVPVKQVIVQVVQVGNEAVQGRGVMGEADGRKCRERGERDFVDVWKVRGGLEVEGVMMKRVEGINRRSRC